MLVLQKMRSIKLHTMLALLNNFLLQRYVVIEATLLHCHAHDSSRALSFFFGSAGSNLLWLASTVVFG